MHNDENPYQAPQTDNLELNVREGAYEPAGKGRRFLNFVLDYFASMAFIIAVVVVVTVFASPELSAAMDAELENDGYGWYDLAALLLYISYYILTEAMFGRTLGKLLTGTRVIKKNGEKPGLGSIIGRTLARFIPFEAFTVLFSNDEYNTGWHDRLSGTVVVMNRSVSS